MKTINAITELKNNLIRACKMKVTSFFRGRSIASSLFENQPVISLTFFWAGGGKENVNLSGLRSVTKSFSQY